MVPQGGVAAFLAPLPVGRLWGVGPVTEGALRRLGVALIGDLARTPEIALAAAIGASQARALHALAKGDDPREVVPDEAAKSVGAEETFGEDSSGAPRWSAPSSGRRGAWAGACAPRASPATS